jgi:hypothetical protein
MFSITVFISITVFFFSFLKRESDRIVNVFHYSFQCATVSWPPSIFKRHMKTRSSRVNNAHETRLKHVEYEGNTRLKHVEYSGY